jgi:hypothetical protein
MLCPGRFGWLLLRGSRGSLRRGDGTHLGRAGQGRCGEEEGEEGETAERHESFVHGNLEVLTGCYGPGAALMFSSDKE